MADKLFLEIVTPYRLVLSEEVDEVVTPGLEGEFGVLPNHTPFLTILKLGEMSYRIGNERWFLVLNWGYAEVGPEKVIILAEGCERAEEIDIERALAAKKRAEERIAIVERKAEEIDIERARASLMRALLRIEVANKRRTT
ncbi:MAG: F0F1 ATP synthase subunit epsilon [Nitrospirota bacterium]